MADLSPLRRRMIEDMTVRNLSPATQRSYISAVSKFSRYFGRSPDRLELEDVRAFQVHLVSIGISWPALNQIVCALRFFYGVTLGEALIPERIPYARDSRLVALDEDHVAFTWKDYRQNGATKIMKLKPDEFIRRFLLHTLPDGFHRIRHFGFMANGHRAAKLALCSKLLDRERTAPNDGEPSPVDTDALTWAKVPACPDCGGVCASSSAFDTASAVPALQLNRSGATHSK